VAVSTGRCNTIIH